MEVYLDKKLIEKNAESVIIVTDYKEIQFHKNKGKNVYLTSSNIVAFTIKK